MITAVFSGFDAKNLNSGLPEKYRPKHQISRLSAQL
jgi:hypothetical protein